MRSTCTTVFVCMVVAGRKRQNLTNIWLRIRVLIIMLIFYLHIFLQWYYEFWGALDSSRINYLGGFWFAFNWNSSKMLKDFIKDKLLSNMILDKSWNLWIWLGFYLKWWLYLYLKEVFWCHWWLLVLDDTSKGHVDLTLFEK